MTLLLASNVILLLFIVIALGAAFGAIPFGLLKFGAAGALFIGLVVGAFVHADSYILGIMQDLGLGLFVYMIGLEAGETILKEIKTQFGLMVASLIAVIIGAVAAMVFGGLLNLEEAISVGVFSGALTSTPSLSLAQVQTGDDIPAVGYSIGYPTGVVCAIIVVALIVNRDWKATKDQVNPNDSILQKTFVDIQTTITPEEIYEQVGEQVRVVSVSRGGGRRTVVDAEKPLFPGTAWSSSLPKPCAMKRFV